MTGVRGACVGVLGSLSSTRRRMVCGTLTDSRLGFSSSRARAAAFSASRLTSRWRS